jgi:hypothetical protein
MRTCISLKVRSPLHILNEIDILDDLKTMAITWIQGQRSGSMNYMPIQFITHNPHLLALVKQIPGEAELG